jgi:uncharacterized membrane protein
MFGKILFAILMFLGIIISFANKNFSMAIFFAGIVCLMIWLIRKRPKQEVRI